MNMYAFVVLVLFLYVYNLYLPFHPQMPINYNISKLNTKYLLANQVDLFGFFRYIDCESLGFFVCVHPNSMVIKSLLFTLLSYPYISTRRRWWGIVPVIKIFNFFHSTFIFVVGFFWFTFSSDQMEFYFLEGMVLLHHLLAIWMIYCHAINTKFDMWSIRHEGTNSLKTNPNVWSFDTKNFSWAILS